MERGVRARRNPRGHRCQAQCRFERGAAAGRYRRAPQAAQRRVARKYAGGVSRLRGGGNGEMGTRGARGQYQAGIADDGSYRSYRCTTPRTEGDERSWQRMLGGQGSYARGRPDGSLLHSKLCYSSIRLIAAQGNMPMIDLYYWTTPNGHKITIFLEETGLPYNVMPVNIGKGEQF